MFNIQFGGSNSSQVLVNMFHTGRSNDDRLEALYINPAYAQYLLSFLKDVRTMPEEEWEQVKGTINSL